MATLDHHLILAAEKATFCRWNRKIPTNLDEVSCMFGAVHEGLLK
jgi:hypothetical protein